MNACRPPCWRWVIAPIWRRGGCVRHTNTIGLIVADIRNPFFTAVSRMVEDIAYERGQRVILCNTDEDPAKEPCICN
jgi:DNA-binding LacI/PurR family transcriptional regulator